VKAAPAAPPPGAIALLLGALNADLGEEVDYSSSEGDDGYSDG
jgi:hypothetical protein